jgi:hypothetical protein
LHRRQRRLLRALLREHPLDEEEDNYQEKNICGVLVQMGGPQFLDKAEFYSTGSYPPSWNGWQRDTRLIDITRPRNGPYRRIASIAYAEHDG